MKLIFYKLRYVTRSEDWRLSLVPFVVGCIYLWMGWLNINLTAASLQLFILSLVTTFGFAALGYFLNEFFDKKTDAAAGKINTLSSLSPFYQALIFIGCIATALLPWLGLPADMFSYQLIVLEISLFLLYSLPFPRFKKIVVLSSITDAGYAYVVPMLLTFHTFSIFTTRIEEEALLSLVPAVFVIGFRNITIHHVDDIFKDQRSNTITLPQLIGVHNTNYLLAFLLAAECILMILWSITVAVYQPLFWGWVMMYVVFILWRFTTLHSGFKIELLSIHPIRHFTDHAYQYLFPVFTLTYVLLVDYKWILLLFFHLLFLFPPYMLKDAQKLFKAGYYKALTFLTVEVRNAISLAFNYPVYFLFRFCGVDLVKEQKSAYQYLADRLKGK